MQGIGVTGYTGCRCDRKSVTSGNDPVIGDFLRRNHEFVTIHTADTFLNMQVFEIWPHVVFVTVEAHFIGIFEQCTLAVRVMTIHAPHT